jgi:hypothetical protein
MGAIYLITGVLPMAIDKAQLEARIKQLSAEQAQTQKRLDALRSEHEDYATRFSEAQRKHDLEGNDNAGLDMTKFRNLRDDTQVQIQKLQNVIAEYPARLEAIKSEIDAVNHRSDLQLLASLKEREIEAFGEYEKAALALADTHYTFAIARSERLNMAEKTTSFARSHQLPVPARGDFSIPAIEQWWLDPGLVGQLRRAFSDVRKAIK